MVDLKAAKSKAPSAEIVREVCAELAEAREMIEELADRPYEEALRYHRELKARRAEAEKGEGGG